MTFDPKDPDPKNSVALFRYRLIADALELCRRVGGKRGIPVRNARGDQCDTARVNSVAYEK